MLPTLTAARVSVRAGHEADYLALLAERRAAALAAGQKFWVFRSSRRDGQFLEFTEAPAGGPPSNAGAELDTKLRAIAYYAADADDVWESVELPRT